MILRVARPTGDLDALLPFYRDGAGLQVLARFEDHDGFDGLVLGGRGAPWHLEFTRAHGHEVPRCQSPDDLLVLYLPEARAWSSAAGRMEAAGFPPVPSFNPYWDARGRTFEDPDGYRLVLANAAWTL